MLMELLAAGDCVAAVAAITGTFIYGGRGLCP